MKFDELKYSGKKAFNLFLSRYVCRKILLQITMSCKFLFDNYINNDDVTTTSERENNFADSFLNVLNTCPFLIVLQKAR